MLYQKDEQLKELKNTVQNIPALSKIPKSKFVMTKQAYKNFSMPIINLFYNLNTALFNTALFPENEPTVGKACEEIVNYILLQCEKDLVDDFYEEKFKLYNHLCIDIIENELCCNYSEYCDVLQSISDSYRQVYEDFEDEIMPFTEISELIKSYKNIRCDIRHAHIYPASKEYLVHSAELILKEISELVTQECKKQYNYPDNLPNRLRLLIHFLNSELKLNSDS